MGFGEVLCWECRHTHQWSVDSALQCNVTIGLHEYRLDSLLFDRLSAVSRLSPCRKSVRSMVLRPQTNRTSPERFRVYTNWHILWKCMQNVKHRFNEDLWHLLEGSQGIEPWFFGRPDRSQSGFNFRQRQEIVLIPAESRPVLGITQLLSSA
jgi:hypothetical protein